MERLTRLRAGFLIGFFLTIILVFALRAFDLQIIQTGGKVVDNTKTFTSVVRVKAARGDILDCNGNVLVTNRASYDLVINHFVLLSADGTNNHLLRLVNLCREMEIAYNDHFPVSKEVPFEYTLDDYNSTWQGYFQLYLPEKGGLDSDISAPLLMKKLRSIYKIPEDWSDADARAVIGLRYEMDLRRDITNLPLFVFLEDASSEALAAILELNIPGMNTEASTVRVYNTKYAAHILGYIADMDPEQWEYYKTIKDEQGNSLYAMDAKVGQVGLEKSFEAYLHGVDGYRVDVVTADGTLLRQYYRTVDGVEQRPKAGQNVELTINLDVQQTAEDALAELIEQLRATAEEGKEVDGADAEGGAVVVMNVKTGQVLACASYPTYDLSSFFEDFEELKNADYAPLYNRALQATYAPGSTYKMSMIIAGINSGTISSGTMLEDKGVFDKYEGFTANCLRWTQSHRTHGFLNAITALEKSCNYFFYELADRMNLQVIDAVAKSLGLGELTGVELPEQQGHRANAETKASLVQGFDGQWFPADQILTSIGQSYNQFTPMQLCVYTSTLANRGVRYQATFLNRVLSSDYRDLVYENQPVVVSTLQISDDAYYAYTEGMKAVVGSGGTAYTAFKGFPIQVAAKTGTAQHGGGSHTSDHGAFVCYAPFDDPEIAIVVYGEKAGHGSTMAQIGREILEAYFKVDQSDEMVNGENQIS